MVMQISFPRYNNTLSAADRRTVVII